MSARIQQNLEAAVKAFKKIEIKDLEHLSSLTPISGFISCEYNPANLAIWSDIYDIKWTSLDGIPIVNIAKDDALLFPHIPGMTPSLLRDISSTMIAHGFSGKITQAPSEYLERHPEISEFFFVEPDADLADYIYETTKLARLSGSSLSKKRNLISQFKREFGEVDARELSERYFAECLALAETFCDETSTASAREELSALKRAFELFEPLRLGGTAVFADGDLIGFAVTSRHLDGSCCVHFEKVRNEVKGAAQVVNQKTAESLMGKYEFINREQDLGIPGLRQAKRSYKPTLVLLNNVLLPKTLATKGDCL